jgi:hypothetical protein
VGERFEREEESDQHKKIRRISVVGEGKKIRLGEG